MQNTDRHKEKTAVDGKYVRPLRAAELMKAARVMMQTVYIYGSAGHGKTSLVMDFLARRRYRYYSAVDNDTLQNLEEDAAELGQGSDLSGRWGKQPVVVVDDLNLLDMADNMEQWYAILERLARMKSVWLILISRSPVPRWLKPLYFQYLFVVVNEDALRLTDKEKQAYFEKWDISMPDERKERIWKLARGYPMFLRVLVMQMKELCSNQEQGSINYKAAEQAAIEQAQKDLCDYLESHVYDQWNIELQEFLMDISVVECFDLQMAQIVSKKSNAGQLISLAQEAGNFLEEHGSGDTVVYRLRKYMKQTLMRWLFRKTSCVHIDGLYNSAGSVYESRGDIPMALCMYELCHNEEGISRLLIQNARKNPGMGHYFELRKYYLALPEETIRESAELLCGMSMLHSILMDVDESERWYQELEQYAKLQTGNKRRVAQARLLYLDIGLPHRGTMRMTDLIKRAGIWLVESRMELPELSVTNNQPSIMNGGKDFCEWSRHDRELAKSIGKLVEQVLGRWGKGLVSLALAESFFEKGGDRYEISSLANKGRMQADSGGKPGLVFVAVGIQAQLAVLNNNMEDAFEMLESFHTRAQKEAPQMLQDIEILKTRFMLYVGRNSEVAQWMSDAPDENSAFCTLDRFAYMAKIRCYLLAGKKEKAMSLTQSMIVYAEKMHRTYINMEANLLLAIIQYRLDDRNWHGTLQSVITQAEEYHFVRILTREGAALWNLLKTGDFIWKDDSYKKQVLSECKHMAELYPAYLNEAQEGNVLLSDKALKILRLQAQGMTVGQIADQIGLSKAGVKYYNQETYRKLGVSGKAAAVSEAGNRGLL